MKIKINFANHLINHVSDIAASAQSAFGEPSVQTWVTMPGIGFTTFIGAYPHDGPLPGTPVEGYQSLRKSDLLRSLDCLVAVGSSYAPSPVPTTIYKADVDAVDAGGLNKFQNPLSFSVSSALAFATPGTPGYVIVSDGAGTSTRNDTYSGTIRSRYVLEFFLYSTAPGLRPGLTYYDIDVAFTEGDLDLNQEYTTPGAATVTLGIDLYTKVEAFLVSPTVDIQLRDVELGHYEFGPGLGGFNYVGESISGSAELILANVQGVICNGAVTSVVPSTITGSTGEIHEDIEYLTALTFSDGTAGTILGGSTDSFGGGDGAGDVGAFAIQQNHAGSTFGSNDLPLDSPGDATITVEWDGAYVWALDTASYSALASTYPTFRRLSNGYSGL